MPTLNDAAVRTSLKRSMIVEVATRSAKGHPFVTPLWFVVDRGVVYITTGPESRAGRNVAQNPEVTLLFDGRGNASSYQIIRLHGSATCHRVLPSWRVILRVALKYYAAPHAIAVELRNLRLWPLRRLYYAQNGGASGHLQVVPTSVEFLPRP